MPETMPSLNNRKSNAIFIAFDDAYFHFAISFVNSLLLNYPDYPTLIVNYSGKSEKVLSYIRQIPRALILEHINGLDFDLGIVGKPVIYNRFILWSELFSEYENILHLDVDTLVLGSLDELFECEEFFMALDNQPKAKIFLKDDSYFYKAIPVQHDAQLDIKLIEDGIHADSIDMPMGNAGVFLIPAKYRSRESYEQLIELGRRYNQHITYADQSIISIWCYINKINLSEKLQWNYQVDFLTRNDLKIEAHKIKILHFSGNSKREITYYESLPTPVKDLYLRCDELRRYFTKSRNSVNHQLAILFEIHNLQKIDTIKAEQVYLHWGLNQVIETIRATNENNFEVGRNIFLKYEGAEAFNRIPRESAKNSILVFDETVCQISRQEIFSEKFREKIQYFSGLICSQYSLKLALQKICKVPTILANIAFEEKIDSAALNEKKSHKILILIENQEAYLKMAKDYNNPAFPVHIINNEGLSFEEFILQVNLSIDEKTYVIDLSNSYYWWVILAATKSTIVFGNNQNDYQRTCFPYSSFDQMDTAEIYKKIYSLAESFQEDEFLRNLAAAKGNKFSVSNVRNKLINELNYLNFLPNIKFFTESSDHEFTFEQAIVCLNEGTISPVDRDEFVVFCLIKNGKHYLSQWLLHYETLGAKHFYIVDNGSSDGSIDALVARNDVTLFSTELEFRLFENEIRQTIIAKYCRGCWCLSVDIDEFFEFTYSNCVDMKAFLEYQNSFGYTCVTAFMQDMLMREDTQSTSFLHDNIYVNNEFLCWSHYKNLPKTYSKYNQYDDNLIFYYGGARTECFSGDPSQMLLLKHALTFQDGSLEPHTDPHFCDKANISDTIAVLLHYKFTSFIEDTVIERAEKEVFNYFSTQHYKVYRDFIKKNSSLLATASAVKYESASQLESMGIKLSSKEFRKYFQQKGLSRF